MFCPSCGVENPDGARFCVDCGREFGKIDGKADGPARRRILGWVAGIVAAATIGAIGWSVLGGVDKPILDMQVAIRFVDSDPATLASAASTLRTRLDILGIDGVVTIRDGVLVIALPTDLDDSVVDRLRGKGELMTMRSVIEIGGTAGGPLADGRHADWEGWFVSEDGYYHLDRAGLASQELVSASAEKFETGQWGVRLTFSEEGREDFRELTRYAAQYPIGDPRRQIAITVGDLVVSSPQVAESVDPNTGINAGEAVISMGAGSDQREEADALAATIMFGVLPDLDQVQVSRP